MRLVLSILAVLMLLHSGAFANPYPCSDYPVDSCELPVEFGHTASVEESGIRVTLAAQQSAFVQGEVIDLLLAFENIGSESFCMNFGYNPDDAIFALPSGCSDPAAACADASPWSFPFVITFAPGLGLGLEPGQCRVYTYYAWDTTAHPAAPGDYDLVGGLFEASFDESFGQFRMPSTGVTLPIEISAGVPVSQISAGMLKARY